MSLAILKKKTKATSPYFSKEHCFVLNMTGRGGGIKTKLKIVDFVLTKLNLSLM